MKHIYHTVRLLVGVMSLSALCAPARASGAELKDETLKAWNGYIQKANVEMDERLRGPFLWVDEVPERAQQVRDGVILVSPVGHRIRSPWHLD